MGVRPAACNPTRYNLPSCLLIILAILHCTTSASSFCAHSVSDNVTDGTLEIVAAQPTEGFISSPKYPGPYPANQDCTYRLNALPTAALVIHLELVDLDLGHRLPKSQQCLREFLRLKVTDRDGREYIGDRICGPMRDMSGPMKEMQPSVEIRFVSSRTSTERRGFKLKYSFVAEATISAPPSLYFDANPRFRDECGGVNDFGASSGEIRSPGYPSTYPRNVSYTVASVKMSSRMAACVT